MQVVGYFVGLHADQGRADLVDGAIIRFHVRIREMFGKCLLYAGKKILAESAAAPDEIFPEPGLAFMDAQARAAREGRGFVGDGRTLLVHGVTGLVHGRVHGHAEVAAVEARGDADVVAPEVGAERMRGLVLTPPRHVVADGFYDVEGEGALFVNREIAVQNAVVYGRFALRDGLRQRDQSRLHIGEHGGDIGLRRSRLVLVYERIVGMRLVAQMLGSLARQIQHLFQAGRELIEVGHLAGAYPHLLRQRGMATEFHHQIFGQFRGAVIAAAQAGQQANIVAVRVLRVRFGFGSCRSRPISSPVSIW